RDTELHIVSAWAVPPALYGPGVVPLDPVVLDSFRRRGQEVADDALASVKELRPSLQVEAVAVQGEPADALLERGADVDLIVVGRRGLGGFKTLLLGSVSQQVVQHATCPVVIVQ